MLLQVTPHINAGRAGVARRAGGGQQSRRRGLPAIGDAPPINTRSVQTYVAVQSGQTMIMGGLISDTRAEHVRRACRCCRASRSSGGLFGSQELKNNRTELVLFITPRVVENEVDIRGAIEDLRRKMENMDAVRSRCIRPIIGPVFPNTAVNPNLAPFTTRRREQPAAAAERGRRSRRRGPAPRPSRRRRQYAPHKSISFSRD